MTRTTSLLAALALTLGAVPALAEPDKGDPGAPSATEGASSGDYGSQETGNPSESGPNENVQPGPLQEGPADPAAGDTPAARIPTDK
ncbi:MAG: hypothetical protein AB7S70_06060 [Hyphomicrobium sp.]|uniref:hypothetical protein n=1 Tax=Hyphomicrobium sp. TaxID=82 RepID=UPI003D09F48A